MSTVFGSEGEPRPVTRRRFLLVLAATGVGASGLLAACGGGAATTSGAATSAPAGGAATTAPVAAATSAPAAATAAPAADATAAPAAGGATPAAGAATPVAGATTAAGSGAKLSGKVVFGAFVDPAQDPMRVLIQEWGQLRGVETAWEEFPYSTWYEKALNDGQSKTGAYDVLVLDDPWIPIFAGGGYLANLSKMGYTPDADFQKQSIDLGYWPPREGAVAPGVTGDPELYAIPTIGDVMSLVYRKDIFPKPPETWDDIVATAKEKTDIGKEQYGWVTRGLKGGPIVVSYLPILNSYGGEIFDEKWEPIFNNDAGIGALERYISLREFMPDGVTEWDSNEEGTAFLAGKAFAANLWGGWVRQVDLADKSQIAGKAEFGIPPKQVRHAAHIGLFISGVSEFSKNKEAAADFLFWFAQNDIQTRFAGMGGVPVKNPAFTDKDAVSKARWLPALKNSLDNSFPRPRTPEWSKVEEILGTKLSEAFVAKGGAKEKLDEAAAEVKEFLGTVGYYA
jgi:multiple sugar transport system substrate-binding protein